MAIDNSNNDNGNDTWPSRAVVCGSMSNTVVVVVVVVVFEEKREKVSHFFWVGRLTESSFHFPTFYPKIKRVDSVI